MMLVTGMVELLAGWRGRPFDWTAAQVATKLARSFVLIRTVRPIVLCCQHDDRHDEPAQPSAAAAAGRRGTDPRHDPARGRVASHRRGAGRPVDREPGRG